MDEITVKCIGKTTLIAKGSSLVVERKKEEQTFPIANIQTFTIKKPGVMTNGLITFTTAQAATVGVNLGFGVGAAFGGEKAFAFTSDQYEAACSLRDYITNFTAASAPALASEIPDAAGKQVVSVVEEIRGLKELLDEGILTQEEFDAKKKQLLGI